MSHARHICCRLFLLAAMTSALGCGRNFILPTLAPAPAWQQVAEAKKYDPFPDPTIAPPIVGGRPLGFREPRAEPDFIKTTPPWFNSPTPAAYPAYPTAGYPAYPAASNVVVHPPPLGSAMSPAPATYPTYPSAVSSPPVVSNTATTAPVAYGRKFDGP